MDPGFRNGCKIAVLDEHGALLHHEIIYPHPPQSEKIKALGAVQSMLETYGVQAVAIGNGTASRETMDFFRRVNLPEGCWPKCEAQSTLILTWAFFSTMTMAENEQLEAHANAMRLRVKSLK